MENREILFRGKNIENNEWVYGDLYQEKYPFKNKIKEIYIVEYRPDLCLFSGANDINHYWRIVIPETVGQFTGLTDNNGTKIFEGDIVCLDKCRYWVIKWSGRGFVGDPIDKCIQEDTLYNNNYLQFKVTGNIHDKV